MESGSKKAEIKPPSSTNKPSFQRFSRHKSAGKSKMDEAVVFESQQSKREGVAEIEPKVLEPFIAIPGRTPRKVAIERKKKLFTSVSVEKLLKEEGVDYNKPIAAWLPIEPFDNDDFDVRNPEEWIAMAKGDLIPALALHRSQVETGVFDWKLVLISSYDASKRLFLGIWDDEMQNSVEISKINLVFSSEDPFTFCKRVSYAHQRRKYAESLIRYYFYIDNMPTEEIPTLNPEQKEKIVKKSLKFADIGSI